MIRFLLKITIFSWCVLFAPSMLLAPKSALAQETPAAPPATTKEAAPPERVESPDYGGKAAKPRKRRLEVVVRNLMTQTGFPDTAMQDAVIEHMTSEARLRGALRESGEKLFLALQSSQVSEQQMGMLLKEFQTALDLDTRRRAGAETALDLKIGFSKNARLHAMLLLFGIMGDGALFVPLREPPRPQSYSGPPHKDTRGATNQNPDVYPVDDAPEAAPQK